MWYHHIAWQTGEGLTEGPQYWEDPPRQVGSGWNLKHLTAGEDGRIYGVNDAGELWAYHHTGWEIGEFKWEDPPVKLADGWGSYRYMFAGNGAPDFVGPK